MLVELCMLPISHQDLPITWDRFKWSHEMNTYHIFPTLLQLQKTHGRFGTTQGQVWAMSPTPQKKTIWLFKNLNLVIHFYGTLSHLSILSFDNIHWTFIRFSFIYFGGYYITCVSKWDCNLIFFGRPKVKVQVRAFYFV